MYLAVELTADEVLKELDGVAEWFLFGIYLRVPLSEMKKSKCSKKDIIHTWLQMDQALRTWQKIVDALVGAEQTEIAHRIAAKYGNLLMLIFLFGGGRGGGGNLVCFPI